MSQEISFAGLSNRQLKDAIEDRHSVRDYLENKPVEQEKLDILIREIDRINSAGEQLAFRLVTGEPRAFGGRWASYGNFKNVENYLVIAGAKGKDIDVACGRRGEELVLLLQHLGLNTCWVGLTYKKIAGAFEIGKDDAIRCVIAFGYGKDTKGRAHKIKSPEDVSNIGPNSPDWFLRGVDMALLAPTAVNQQKFYFELQGDNSVKASARRSLVGYSRIDLGIAITHFLIGADKEDLELTIN